MSHNLWYNYRGQVSQVVASVIGIEESEWVLVMCVATMIYLVRKLG